MSGALARLLSPLTSRSLWRRWVHLVMGGALLMPYVMLGSVLAAWGSQQRTDVLALGALAWVVPLCLPAVAVTALIVPAIRTVEGTAAKELLGGHAAALAIGKARAWTDRWRTAAWFVLHLALGGVVSALTLSMPPLAFVLLAEPVADFYPLVPREWDTVWAPLAGLAVLAGLVSLAAAAGAVLARSAPVLLGPSPAQRLAELEQQAGELAERNRLARELHDSVGHALTTTTLQAGAANRVLDTDPEFARRALTAIEEAGRAALEDLDYVLGLLRDGAGDKSPQRTLTDLDGLLTSVRSTGVTIDADITGDVEGVAPAVSREAYRIVQEGLTNALRHAGKVPVTLWLAVGPEQLELTMSNPVAGAHQRPRQGTDGGRGLTGMRERVTILRGEMTAAADSGEWRVAVRLPLGRVT